MDYQKATLDRKSTGLRIRELLASSNYTYEEVASLLELSTPRVIYEWVSGKKLPGLENLINLSRIFNVTVEDVVVMR